MTKQQILDYFCSRNFMGSTCQNCRGYKADKCVSYERLDQMITEMVEGCPSKGIAGFEDDGTCSQFNFISVEQIEAWKRKTLQEAK